MAKDGEDWHGLKKQRKKKLLKPYRFPLTYYWPFSCSGMTEPPKSANRPCGASILGAITCTRARSSSVSKKPIYLSIVFFYALLFERHLIIESKQRSENLCHERLKMKYEKPPVQRGPYLSPAPIRTKTKVHYCHVRHAQCFRSEFCQNCQSVAEMVVLPQRKVSLCVAMYQSALLSLEFRLNSVLVSSVAKTKFKKFVQNSRSTFSEVLHRQ